MQVADDVQKGRQHVEQILLYCETDAKKKNNTNKNTIDNETEEVNREQNRKK